jgi:hypothetical protein
MNKYLQKASEKNEHLQKAAEHTKELIDQMTELYMKQLGEKINRIFKSNWFVKELKEEYFSIVDMDDFEIVIAFDTNGNLQIDTMDLFQNSPIFFEYQQDIDILKTIIKLHDNKEDFRKFFIDYQKAINPMWESYYILKRASNE